MALAIVLILLVVGTVVFHFASPWWFTEIASNWGAIDTTVNITFLVTGVVFIIAGWAMFRIIDPKLKALSLAFEGKQAGHLARSGVQRPA